MSDYHGIMETLKIMHSNQPGSKKRHPRSITNDGFDRIQKIKQRIQERKKQDIDG